jgi:hypothetical protein
LNCAEDWTQYPENISNYLATGENSGEKLQFSPPTTQSRPSIKKILTERMKVIKTPEQKLGLKCTNFNAETQENMKKKKKKAPRLSKSHQLCNNRL